MYCVYLNGHAVVWLMVLSYSPSNVHRWHQQNTTGTPPLGVFVCASCAIGNKIYYFGGWCYHNECHHNSLHELDIENFNWTLCLPNTENGPMKKNECGMVVFNQTLLVFGGLGNPPRNPQPSAQYNGDGLGGELVCTNEHHFHTLGTGRLTDICWETIYLGIR